MLPRRNVTHVRDYYAPSILLLAATPCVYFQQCPFRCWRCVFTTFVIYSINTLFGQYYWYCFNVFIFSVKSNELIVLPFFFSSTAVISIVVEVVYIASFLRRFRLLLDMPTRIITRRIPHWSVQCMVLKCVNVCLTAWRLAGVTVIKGFLCYRKKVGRDKLSRNRSIHAIVRRTYRLIFVYGKAVDGNFHL